MALLAGPFDRPDGGYTQHRIGGAARLAHRADHLNTLVLVLSRILDALESICRSARGRARRVLAARGVSVAPAAAPAPTVIPR
jgi:hypothetical protein